MSARDKFDPKSPPPSVQVQVAGEITVEEDTPVEVPMPIRDPHRVIVEPAQVGERLKTLSQGYNALTVKVGQVEAQLNGVRLGLAGVNGQLGVLVVTNQQQNELMTKMIGTEFETRRTHMVIDSETQAVKDRAKTEDTASRVKLRRELTGKVLGAIIAVAGAVGAAVASLLHGC